ncbi:6361_t:CDS:2, partial [Funneliformis caledonium]
MNRRTGSDQLFGISSDQLIGTSSRNPVQTGSDEQQEQDFSLV